MLGWFKSALGLGEQTFDNPVCGGCQEPVGLGHAQTTVNGITYHNRCKEKGTP